MPGWEAADVASPLALPAQRIGTGLAGGTVKDADTLAAELEAHPDYRVLRRLDLTHVGEALAGGRCAHAVVLDTETTGMDAATDKVIELALVKFEYDRRAGAVGRVLEVYDGLEDPGRPIPPESTAIHHITDEMVAGKRLDEVAIERLLDGVGVVIAHNAGFDRPFVERRLPSFAALPWACSLREVPWDALGLGGAKLEYLAYRYGFFFEGHRAEIDCRALLEVLRRPVPGSAEPRTAFEYLLESARAPSFRVWATGHRSRARMCSRRGGTAGRPISACGTGTSAPRSGRRNSPGSRRRCTGARTRASRSRSSMRGRGIRGGMGRKSG